ncbi:zinc finger protein 185 isoform 2-T2 [Discoglossus pictus]
MTSLQSKKGGGTEGDRKTILKQMKVRTTLKKDKSWIHQQSSEDEKDETPSPVSPQLKSLEGRKFLWSPTTESKTERDSPTFRAREVSTSSSPPVQSLNKDSSTFRAREVSTSSSPPVQSFNKQTTNNGNDTRTSSPSPQSPTTDTKPPASRQSTGYIIRGQPFNTTSSTKPNQYSYNGYQKSYVTQNKSASLPRVPTATGYKMSTEEYKKLAPFNTRKTSLGDLSDDETPVSSEEHAKRTEVASNIVKNAAVNQQSYVFSAKRKSGVETLESPNPFLAKRVDIEDEEDRGNKKSQTLPKSLSSYLLDDANKNDKTTSEINKPYSTDRRSTSTTTVTGRDSGRKPSDVPKLTSSSTTCITESVVKPLPGKISVVRNEREEVKNEENDHKKSESLPKSLAHYLYEDANRFENNWKVEEQPPSSSQPSPARTDRTTSETNKPYSTDRRRTTTTTTVTGKDSDDGKAPKSTSESRSSYTRTVTTRNDGVDITKEENEHKKNESLPNSLAHYLYEDANRFENNWKSEDQPPSSSPARDVSDAPQLTSSSTTRFTETTIKPLPGRITLVRDESNNEQPKTTRESRSATTRTVTTRNDGATNNRDVPELTSWTAGSDLETTNTVIKPGPGKITIIRGESDDDGETELPKTTTESRSAIRRTVESRNESYGGSTEGPKLTSWTTTNTTESENPEIRPGPGKITYLRDDSDDRRGVPSTSAERRTTTVTETRTERVKPEPLPRDLKPKETTSVTSSTSNGNQPDLISWGDLEEKPKPANRDVPKPLPRLTDTEKEDKDMEPPLIVMSPEFTDNRKPNPPTRPGTINTVDETRYRVPEILEELDAKPSISRIVTESGNRNLTSTTRYDSSRTPEGRRSETTSSSRPSPRPRENTTTTVTESRYRVPETINDRTLDSSPTRSNSRSTVTTTRSTEPNYTEYTEEIGSRSTRTVSSSRERITTTTTVETRYESPSTSDAEYDPKELNKGILFVKEYVNTSENLASPTYSGLPDYSEGSERASFVSSSYLFGSAPKRSDEGPCTYCGREIKDCAKIMLEHLNIYCHEYCFKCGICNKPMGDLIDSLYIHRDVVHCESCYEKLF